MATQQPQNEWRLLSVGVDERGTPVLRLIDRERSITEVPTSVASMSKLAAHGARIVNGQVR